MIIKENDKKENLSNQRTRFAEFLVDVKFVQFSDLAKSNSIPEKDFIKIQKYLDSKGFKKDIIKNLFSQETSLLLDENFKEFITNNDLDTCNGHVDYYLFKLNDILNLETLVYLGGVEWYNSLYSTDEHIIKYAYGYHKTPYGKLYLNQLGISVENFIINVYSSIKNFISNVPNKNFNAYLLSNDIDIEVDLCDYISTDDDSFIIFYTELTDFLRSKTKNKLDDDVISSLIISSLDILNILNVRDTGYELIFTYL